MKTLVLGATGKTGRKVAKRLQQLDADIRIGSRTASLPFDWENNATWPAALEGIEAVYITFQPDLGIPGASTIIEDFCKAALQAGVKKLVLLSGRGEEEAQASEQVVMRSGLEWTIVRASWFSQNFSESFILDSVLAGHGVLPVGEVLEPFIDTDDIADVAVAALTEDGHAGKVYEVTGPRLLTFLQAVKEISDEIGREITFHEVTVDEYAAILAEYQVPDGFIELLKYLFSEVLDGRNAYLSHGVEEALGRKPKDFSAYVKETAASGAWDNAD
ncbi:NAD(P)H-binding protein [Dyadobacter sp. CY326]|uniref:NAD(P)H-binding protein n=1 Tax=Dyadobacter sp. CY326 TaxID=2907300 RepID=UPI001F43A494|nr:NAD(P)H-binding protein [Dyadobacter sp. CY326]MCE7064864.1 NAD(P)H-binding protein [Dyadobacter sp. CY326]